VYLSAGYLTTVLVFFGTAIPVLIVLVLSALGALEVPARLLLIMLPVPILAALTLQLLLYVLPDLRSMTRARDINAKLPYALNYITTMASAGATPEAIFASLAKQPIYGAVADEAAWITRDIRILGMDIITALGRAIDRSPSTKFQDFLQGAVTTLTSGGELRQYLLNKAEQFIYENRQDQRKFLDGLGVLAESFVTVVVAGPLFLIVILSVMTSMGGDADQVLVLGYTLVLFLIPASQAGFAMAIKTMTPEA
jgi:archaeal flagellar protein FlaJ